MSLGGRELRDGAASTPLLLLEEQKGGPGMKVGAGEGAWAPWFRTGEAKLAQPSMSGGT